MKKKAAVGPRFLILISNFGFYCYLHNVWGQSKIKLMVLFSMPMNEPAEQIYWSKAVRKYG